MVKPVKFTRDSGCLARDEFLVISYWDHMLIYMIYKYDIFEKLHIFNFFIVGHCNALH